MGVYNKVILYSCVNFKISKVVILITLLMVFFLE